MTPALGPRRARARWLATAALLVVGLVALSASARVVDRVIYLFDAPETGGPSTPRPIFERELAFEARDAFAQRRLRDAEQSRGAVEAPRLHDGDDLFPVPQFHRGTLSPRRARGQTNGSEPWGDRP